MRLFVAVPLPDPLAGLLASAAAAIAPDGVRTVRPKSLHVTVHFLDEVEADAVPELAEALAAACAGRDPFTLRFETIAPAPPRRPRMLWACAAPSPDYAALALAVCGAAVSAAPLARPVRTASPHITLARAPGRARVRFADPVHVEGGDLAVDACALWSSQREPGGSRYTALASLPLGAQPGRRR
jgi:RNA 2',3'-cyclic 3'-phosphodiesterase